MKTRSNNSKPILFSGPMVRAILDGTKTQTRRVVKPQPNEDGLADDALPADPYGYAWRGSDGSERQCPYGRPGDLLWVRETFSATGKVRVAYEADMSTWGVADVFNVADNIVVPHAKVLPGKLEFTPKRWTPSIHMPRWASRLTLEIVSVRVERLQDISDADARAEGVIRVNGTSEEDFAQTNRDAYEILWESINGPGSWALNPWVWVVEFKQVSSDSKGAA